MEGNSRREGLFKTNKNQGFRLMINKIRNENSDFYNSQSKVYFLY
jgi:hypothetical protein